MRNPNLKIIPIPNRFTPSVEAHKSINKQMTKISLFRRTLVSLAVSERRCIVSSSAGALKAVLLPLKRDDKPIVRAIAVKPRVTSVL
eukprot:461557-Amorphochlora_amoeboformis.AAC.1